VSRLRVLIADDDDGFRGALAELLSTRGVDVVGTARDGREAVERFRALAPDVVLMDVVMPVCDGIEATRQIVALDPHARVVALTAGDDHRALALCLAAGAKGALKKIPDSIALAPLMLALAGATAAPKSSRSESTRKSSMSVNRRRLVAPTALAALALAIAPPTVAARARAVNAKLGEYSIKLSRSSTASGPVTFRIVLCNLAGHYSGGMHANLNVR
jgi:DNA-binding NarL/FixJ family response regulator